MCPDPNCKIRGPHLHDVSSENTDTSLREQLQDFEKENGVLREAISDAWQSYSTCQKALTEARAQVEELTTQNRMLSQYLIDTSEGFECLPGCDSNGHDPTCPVSNPLLAWRLTRRQVQELTSERDQARAELNKLLRIIQDPDAGAP